MSLGIKTITTGVGFKFQGFILSGDVIEQRMINAGDHYN